MELNKMLTGISDASMFSDITKPTGWFNTGSIALNYIISGSVFGGFPFGRVVELYGPESSGKSTVGYSAIAEAQKLGYMTYLIDTENVFDSTQVQRCGIDPEKLIYTTPKNATTMFNTMYTVLNKVYITNKSDVPMLVVWDSVAASSLLDGDKSFDNVAVGKLARIVSDHMNKILPLVSNNPVCLVCVNHTRNNLAGFRVVEDTPGGKAIKFYASVRVRISKKASLYLPSKTDGKDSKEEIGILSTVKCIKNKTFRPNLQTTVTINWANGVDSISSIYTLAKDLNVFKTAGAYVSYNNENKRKGDWVGLLEASSEFREQILKEIDAVLCNESFNSVGVKEDASLTLESVEEDE